MHGWGRGERQSKQHRGAERTPWVCFLGLLGRGVLLPQGDQLSTVCVSGPGTMASWRLNSGRKKPRRKLPGVREGPRLCQRNASPGPGPPDPLAHETLIQGGKVQATAPGSRGWGMWRKTRSWSPGLGPAEQGTPSSPLGPHHLASSQSSTFGRHLVVIRSPAETRVGPGSRPCSKDRWTFQGSGGYRLEAGLGQT